jgi:hypothetical protein
MSTILAIIEDFGDIRIINKTLSRCLLFCLSSRPLLEHLNPSQITRIYDFCVRFFLAEGLERDRTSYDRRSECADLALSFSIIATCQGLDCMTLRDITNNNSKFLGLIEKYLNMYTEENSSFELFLGSSLQILLRLDVNELEKSFSFLKGVLFHLLEFLKSKNEATRHWAVNLLRFYVSIGSQRSEDEEERSKPTSFLSNCHKIQTQLFTVLENFPTPFHVVPDDLPLLNSGEINELKPAKSYPVAAAILTLAADISWLSFQSSEDHTSQTESTETETGARKRVKMEKKKPHLLTLLNSGKINQILASLQIIGLISSRHPKFTEEVIQHYLSYMNNFLNSHDPLISHQACYTLSILVEREDGQLSQYFNDWWASALTSLGLISSCCQHLPFVLLAKLVDTLKIKANLMKHLMETILSLPLSSFRESILNCLISLNKFANLWDKENIRRQLDLMIKLAGHFSSKNEARLCCAIFDTLASILEIRSWKMEKSFQWFDLSSIPPLLEDRLIFEHAFHMTEIRLGKASGFTGQELVKYLLPLEPIARSGEKNDLRLEFFLETCSKSLGSIPEKSNWRSAFSMLLFYLKFVQFFDLQSSSHYASFDIKSKLVQLSELLLESIDTITYDDIANILFPFARLSEGFDSVFLASLEPTLALRLCKIILKSPNPTRKKLEKPGANSIFVFSTYGICMDTNQIKEISRKAELCIALLQHLPLDTPEFGAFSEFILELLKCNDESVSNIYILGNLWEKIAPLLSEG